MMLFGWLAPNRSIDTRPVLRQMAAALRVHPRQDIEMWVEPGFGVGLIRMPPLGNGAREPGPVLDDTRRFALWMAGEAFAWGVEPLTARESQSAKFRTRLLDRVLQDSVRSISALDGEYQVAIWDRAERQLSLAVDRFAALPLYWSDKGKGFAFAGGVRGVLVAPGLELRPDTTAIQQAVTFGGFRLGGRTNVADVHMAPPAGVVVGRANECHVHRYWRWDEAPSPVGSPPDAMLRQTQDAWRRAVKLRLEGSNRPGLTLSGGLDSRAILAEASLHAPRVSAVTYGVPQSDDARFAKRAARAASAEWRLFPLYADGWFDRRLSHVLATDGLIDFVDLMHAEVLPNLSESMDLYLSGYIGDLVSGGTYLEIKTVDEVLGAMPYYGGRLGVDIDAARRMAEEALANLCGQGHFITYEHKLPQSTNRITAAARPWVRVRRPFVDYAFWTQAYTVPVELRRSHWWHEAWLTETYPRLFARIPNQRTGVPAGASNARRHVTRAARYGWRRLLGAAARLGAPVVPPDRSYHPDWRAWRVPEIRDRMTSVILRPDSISAQVFGRQRLEATLTDYFERDAAPAQVIGALFVYEQYHRGLPAAVALARQQRHESSAERLTAIATPEVQRQGELH